jgi:hypothetical protein
MEFEDDAGCYSQGRLKILKRGGLLSTDTNFPTGADICESTSKGLNAPSRIAEAIGEPSRTKPKPRFKRLLDKLTRKTLVEVNKIDVKPPKAREEGCYICIDAGEDMLEARRKIVACLDIIRDKEGTNGFISALILLSVDGQPNTYRHVGFSTMTKDFFQDVELTSVTIIWVMAIMLRKRCALTTQKLEEPHQTTVAGTKLKKLQVLLFAHPWKGA